MSTYLLPVAVSLDATQLHPTTTAASRNPLHIRLFDVKFHQLLKSVVNYSLTTAHDHQELLQVDNSVPIRVNLAEKKVGLVFCYC